MIDEITKDYDRLPRSWRDDLVHNIQSEQSQVCFALTQCTIIATIYFTVV